MQYLRHSHAPRNRFSHQGLKGPATVVAADSSQQQFARIPELDGRRQLPAGTSTRVAAGHHGLVPARRLTGSRRSTNQETSVHVS
jgi:hypothetical protein